MGAVCAGCTSITVAFVVIGQSENSTDPSGPTERYTWALFSVAGRGAISEAGGAAPAGAPEGRGT